VQSEEPYWLNEAYSEPILASDVGLVDRNRQLSVLTKAVILAFFNKSGRFLDYGGGYGLLVRMMRDAGFDFYRYDRYCENLFARSFDADLERPGSYELIVASEVLEHLVQPIAEIERMLALSTSVLFTTSLLTFPAPKPDDWWYYALDGGQHIGLFTLTSLRVVAHKFNLNLYSDGRAVHLLTAKALPAPLFSLVSRYRFARLVSALSHRRSLLMSDYFAITGKHLV
jgi:hypothetical protein